MYDYTIVGLCSYKPCELKYLQDEYKKHKTRVNVKDKDLLQDCILLVNWEFTI